MNQEHDVFQKPRQPVMPFGSKGEKYGKKPFPIVLIARFVIS